MSCKLCAASTGLVVKSTGCELQADDILQTSTGFAFDPNEGQHGYKFGVDPTTGVTVYVRTDTLSHTTHALLVHILDMSLSALYCTATTVSV